MIIIVITRCSGSSCCYTGGCSARSTAGVLVAIWIAVVNNSNNSIVVIITEVVELVIAVI